ncbi:hypothetical protein [Fimbriimonas ginsengisoli]|uniref:Uncharacterized protein n=1 Tax=Fimbriimonas ginsengisoli Gsoil 348 TaxID=661478 RepID=A0A068NP28_FIMGI|nr:hypothetical protein [Fimbriimonas ginsengisoli]AIE85318.1 hypothetical protein OP10G_1950 [Fimbriimonas ginsengisoli Gsoil 348]
MQNRTQNRPRPAEAARLALRRLVRRNNHESIRPGRSTVALPEDRTRRDSLHGYVVCFELGEATIVAEGGLFAFQVPMRELQIGQRVRFIREGGEFELV